MAGEVGWEVTPKNVLRAVAVFVLIGGACTYAVHRSGRVRTQIGQTSEAVTNLQLLVEYSLAHYAAHARYPESAPLTPAQSACESSGLSKPAEAKWSHATWRALYFAPDAPLRYQYEYVSNGVTFTARALGDLDCDGILSTFERVGGVSDDGAAVVGAGLYLNRKFE